jgi:hypothetical protein
VPVALVGIPGRHRPLRAGDNGTGLPMAPKTREGGWIMADTIGQDKIGGLEVTRQEDGRYALDFTAGARNGPFIVITAMQWVALCRLIRRYREDLAT